MSQRPVAIGLMVCEQVIVEERTGNLTVVNSFTHRTVQQLPSELTPFVVFALLTDGLGEMPVEVVVERLDTLEEIYRKGISFRFTNPLQDYRCVFRIRDCSFPVAGYYQVRLLADNEPVAQRKVRILQRGNPT